MKVAFLIDGFNVYHSIRLALTKKLIQHAKWLDYRTFCHTLITDLSYFERGSVASGIYYFSALATHLPDKNIIYRHLLYIDALKSTGVNVILGNFKKKQARCRHCAQSYYIHEEKETDINIACYLLKLFLQEECDTAVIISGDTDLIAAISMAKDLFSEKKVIVGFPYQRANHHFKQVADFTFDIKAKRYQRYQLQDAVIMDNGTKLNKPSSW